MDSDEDVEEVEDAEPAEVPPKYCKWWKLGSVLLNWPSPMLGEYCWYEL